MIQSSDLHFFVLIVKMGSLSAAAQELGVTPASVSKRLGKLEEQLGASLLNRTTRRLSVTDDGEIYHANAVRILAELEEMERMLSNKRSEPKGLLRLNAPLGFGRSHVAPIVSKFVRRHPDVGVQLQLTDHPLSLVDEAFDIGIRFGEVPDARVIAKKVAENRRLICAAPSYLKKFGVPKAPNDLMQHNCIVLRQNDTAYGSWRFSKGRHAETVKVRGALSSNDGEVTLNWALDGLGVLLRAEWDIAKYLRSGRLQTVLDDYRTPSADIYAVYPEKLNSSAKVKVFIEFLLASFPTHEAGGRAAAPW